MADKEKKKTDKKKDDKKGDEKKDDKKTDDKKDDKKKDDKKADKKKGVEDGADGAEAKPDVKDDEKKDDKKKGDKKGDKKKGDENKDDEKKDDEKKDDEKKDDEKKDDDKKTDDKKGDKKKDDKKKDDKKADKKKGDENGDAELKADVDESQSQSVCQSPSAEPASMELSMKLPDDPTSPIKKEESSAVPDPAATKEAVQPPKGAKPDSPKPHTPVTGSQAPEAKAPDSIISKESALQQKPDSTAVPEQKNTFDAARKLSQENEAMSIMQGKSAFVASDKGSILRCNVLIGSQFPGAKNHYLHGMNSSQQREFMRCLGADLKMGLQRAAGVPTRTTVGLHPPHSADGSVQGSILSHLTSADISDCNSDNTVANKTTAGLVFSWVLTYSSALGAQECINRFQATQQAPVNPADGLNSDIGSPERSAKLGGSGFRLSSPSPDRGQGSPMTSVIQIPQARLQFKETGGQTTDIPFALLSDFIRVENTQTSARLRTPQSNYHNDTMGSFNANSMSPRSASQSMSPLNYTSMSNDFSSHGLKVKKANPAGQRSGYPPGQTLLDSVLDDRGYRQPSHQHSQARSVCYMNGQLAPNTSSLLQSLSVRGPVQQAPVYPFLNTVNDNSGVYNYSNLSPVAQHGYGPESHHRDYYIDQNSNIGTNRNMLIPQTADASVISLLDMQEREMDLQAKEQMTNEAQNMLSQQTAEVQVMMEEQLRRMDEMDLREQRIMAREQEQEQKANPKEDPVMINKYRALEKDLSSVETENEILKVRLNNVTLHNTHAASYAAVPGDGGQQATEAYKAKLFAERERALQQRTQQLVDRESALSPISGGSLAGAMSLVRESSRNRTSADANWDTCRSIASPGGNTSANQFGSPYGTAVGTLRDSGNRGGNARSGSQQTGRSPQGSAILNKLSSMNGARGSGIGQKRSLGGAGSMY